MARCRFTDRYGTFTLDHAGDYRELYFPLAGETGLKSAVTAHLRGDAKTDQDHFLLTPVSVGDLSTSRSGRNFWCRLEDGTLWSAVGCSAAQDAARRTDREDECSLEAGYMWQRVTRQNARLGLRADILSFVLPEGDAEVHQVRLENIGSAPLTLTPVAAVPIYGRSADNLRDHRHVTSLLNRTVVTRYGVTVRPTLSFDERGHRLADTCYAVQGMDQFGAPPASFYAEETAFTGPGGALDWPDALLEDRPGVGPGYQVDGQEALGGLRFPPVTLAPGQAREYTVVLSVCPHDLEPAAPPSLFGDSQAVYACWERVRDYWRSKVRIRFSTGDAAFDGFMAWVAFQPELRRIFGCSFLPHHDYGKGGRGWRDLWQDCLALLLMDPASVREMLVQNFAGVRADGTNATIIGQLPGQFKADRNAITRVWMDHGVWPLMTTLLYIHQTGDLSILRQSQRYFKDRQVRRGTDVDGLWQPGQTWQLDETGAEYEGTVLEHLLVQNLTAFWEVGEHNVPRLRDADWNDALDMAGHRGESVAFANAYAKNLLDLADLVETCAARGETGFPLLEEMDILLEGDGALYADPAAKRALLDRYMAACVHTVSGRRTVHDGHALAASLREKGRWLTEHIRRTQWLTDSRGHGWFNGYYDDNGRPLEGEREGRSNMLLTSQVFAVMAGTATAEQVSAIVESADAYLYDGACGGYRLNTDFGQVKTDMGRMFGFAYGEKENGAVFSHMAVMYANALYRRGFAQAGYRALDSLYRQAMDFDRSMIYPGLPEYFGRGGRGLYHYLTGAASWYLLTAVTEMFGVRGELGSLVIEPKLLACQFGPDRTAAISLPFAGRELEVTFHAPETGEGPFRPLSAALDGADLPFTEGRVSLSPETIAALTEGETHRVSVVLA